MWRNSAWSGLPFMTVPLRATLLATLPAGRAAFFAFLLAIAFDFFFFIEVTRCGSSVKNITKRPAAWNSASPAPCPDRAAQVILKDSSCIGENMGAARYLWIDDSLRPASE